MQVIHGVTYIDTAELAERLHTTANALRVRRCNGTEVVPSVRFGSGVLYRLADAEAFLAGHRRS